MAQARIWAVRTAQIFLLTLAVGLPGGGLSAQTNDELNAGLQFNFSPPGARSMAMGNAFAGRADDATAAFANPAGLLWLRNDEVSAEARAATYTTRYPNSGSATGDPTLCQGIRWQAATEGCLDTVDGLQFADFESSTSGLAYLSYVHTFAPKDKSDASRARGWRLAFFRHELANFKAEIDRAGGAFIGGEGTGRRFRSRQFGVRGSLDLDIQSFGIASAFVLGSNMWAGLALSYHDFQFDALTRRFLSVTNTTAAGDPFAVSLALPGLIDFSDANETDFHNQTGRDTDVSLTLGLLWHGSLRGKSYRWSLGAVYRQAPTFQFDYAYQPGPQGLILQASDPARADPAIEEALSGRADFEVPDALSLGFMIRPLERLHLSFQYDRIEYSNLEPESNIVFHVLEQHGRADCGYFSPSGEPREFVPCQTDETRLARFKVADADELHFGAEYELGWNVKYFVRIGSWYDPDHQMTYEFGSDDVREDLPATVDGLRLPLDRFAPRFAPGEDAIHFTGGLGIVPVGRPFQINVAFDVSDRGDIYSLSFVQFVGRTTGSER